MALPAVEIYCDGSCVPNPGIGGWGAVLVWEKRNKWIYGYIGETTNNSAELIAIIESLRHLKRPCQVTIYSDSKWAVNASSFVWKRSEVHLELWRELDRLCEPHEISWEWVRGHDLHPENTKAHQLANMGRMSGEPNDP